LQLAFSDLFVPTNVHTFIKILNYITKRSFSTCFGASAPSSGSSDTAFPKVIKYKNYGNYIKE
jgi:hypothetical protein